MTALFVLDEPCCARPARPGWRSCYRSLRALDADLREHGGRLVVRHGPARERSCPRSPARSAPRSVHISADFAPYGAARDARVEAAALGDVALVAHRLALRRRTRRVTKADGSPYQVYSAFYRAWREHGWRAPAASDPARSQWTDRRALRPDPGRSRAAGRLAAARGRRSGRASRPGRGFAGTGWPITPTSATAPTSTAPRGCRPTCTSARCTRAPCWPSSAPSDETFRKELAWREFYAAVLHFWPDSARTVFNPKMRQPPVPTDADALPARPGRTGAPATRSSTPECASCSAEGWMHNRVRMIVASFLVKDLHLDWTLGARHFMRHLVDGDLASNQHGWQWTAGTGTDAAPYFRVFNPIAQGRKFDPDGRLHPPLGARAARTAGRRDPRTVAATRRAAGRLPATRSSTTRTNARSRWPTTARSTPSDQRADAPGRRPGHARLEHDQPVAGVERVGRAGHRLDRDRRRARRSGRRR